MEKLKVIVKEGFEKEFEDYCSKNDVFFKVYPLEIFKTRYKVIANENELADIMNIIKSIEPMPIITLG